MMKNMWEDRLKRGGRTTCFNCNLKQEFRGFWLLNIAFKFRAQLSEQPCQNPKYNFSHDEADIC